MDLWLGVLAEPKINGGILGEVGTRLVRSNFEKVRSSDQHWYERQYPPEVVNYIKSMKFGDILSQVLDANELRNVDVFVVPN